MQGKVLRCYAEGSDSGWEATCVDLDLSVQGDSFDDVFRGLSESIVVYLETIEELPESDRNRLLNRRAPRWKRAQFAMAHILYFVFGRRKSQARHDFVTTPDLCPT